MTILTSICRHHQPVILKNLLKRDRMALLRQWLNQFEIRHAIVAHLICRLIPNSCPFERDITVLGRMFHIPALCKLNPLYDEFMSLRFRALSYLADVCHQDITAYIC